MSLNEQALGDRGEEKSPFNRKEPGSERGTHVPWPVGDEQEDWTHWGTELELITNDWTTKYWEETVRRAKMTRLDQNPQKLNTNINN